MDAAEPDETKQDGLSININAPCTNRIAGRDYIEVNLYIGGRGSSPGGRASGEDASIESNSAEAQEVTTATVEVLVPQAVRIAQRIRSEQQSIA